MEVISIERSTYEELLTSFNSFVTMMKEMASRGNDKGLRFGNLIPYQGALNPRLAFISGRIALIFQNRFAFTSFFRNFAAYSKDYGYDYKGTNQGNNRTEE